MISGTFFTALSNTWEAGQKTPCKPQPEFVKREGNVCKVIAGRKIAKGEVVTILKVCENGYADPYHRGSDTRGMVNLIYQADNYDVPENPVYTDYASKCLVQLADGSKVWTYAKNLKLCGGEFSFHEDTEVNGQKVANWFVHNEDGTIEAMDVWCAKHPEGCKKYVKPAEPKFEPSAAACTHAIDLNKVERETAKAILVDGKWVAKSVIFYADDQNIAYCPEWVFANRY